MVIKKIKKYGKDLVISFDKDEIEFFNLKEGDYIYLNESKIKGEKNAKRHEVK